MRQLFLFTALITSLSVAAQNDGTSKQYEDMVKQMMNGMTNVKLSPDYKFNSSVTQHMITYRDGNVQQEMDMKYYLNSSDKIFGIGGATIGGEASENAMKNMITIMDNGNHTMAMFDMDKKTVFAMNMDAFKNMGKMMGGMGGKKPAEKRDASDFKCSKTSKKLTILGHECYEYQCKSSADKTSSTFWISNDADIKQQDYLEAFMPYANSKSLGFTGTVLGMDIYDEVGEMTASMRVTEIKPDEKLQLTTADFKQQQIPSMN